MADLEVCPICEIPLNNKNRLITEDCGHSKCRQCLISEANGCEKCQKNNSNDLKGTNTISEILKTNEKSTEKESKTRRSTIPSHIVKTHNDDNKIIYHCTICDKRFKSRTQQYYHIFCNNSSNKPFKCDECCKYFSTSAHLKYHIAGHSQQSFQCFVCSKHFSKIQILQKHEKLHAAVGEQCTECGAKLRNKEALNIHLKRHQNILPFKCDKCDKMFSLQTSLRMHQQIIHIACKKFKCDLCGKVFNRNSTLKTHSMSHSNQKDHSCTKCAKHFIDKKSLLRHSRIHNVKSKYKCTLCDTSSIRKDNILRHIRNMHPSEDTTCMKEVREECEYADNESSDEKIVSKQLPETENTISEPGNVSNMPKAVANSSVIRCIGNVKPVTIIEEDQTQPKDAVAKETSTAVIHPVVTIHKKLKKAYDPREIYRKILLDDDSTEDNDTNSNNEDITNTANDDQTKQLAQESTVICNGQQSNFSETHWRKNFKHNYQIQFD